MSRAPAGIMAAAFTVAGTSPGAGRIPRGSRGLDGGAVRGLSAEARP